MPRKRKVSSDNALPPRVYRGKSKYEFHPATGGSVSLCPLDAPIHVIWEKYNDVNEAKVRIFTVSIMIERFLTSAQFTDLALETQKDYRKYSLKLSAVFGEMAANAVKPEQVRIYMDRRGLKSKTQANREKSFFSRVYSWSYERGLVKSNPCKGVRQFKETPRDRYITDAEYEAVFSVAPVIVQIAMEIAYLCLARQSDVLALTKSQLLNDGIFIRQGKTGTKQIKAWSDRLRAAIALAGSLPMKDSLSTIYVLHQANGSRYTRDGFNSRWEKTKAAAREKFPEQSFDFTFHDLKAKGVSDLEGNLEEKQRISGHMTISQTAKYDRKTPIVPVVGNQKK